MAYATSERCERSGIAWDGRHGLAHRSCAFPDADGARREEQFSAEPAAQEQRSAECGRGWPAEPAVGRVVDGMAHRLDRLKALGNGQVPRVACTAWRILSANA